MKQKILDWYNAHIVAGWYASAALWVGVVAGALPYLLDWLTAALDAWPTLSEPLNLQPATREGLRLFLLFVALPAARAWQQRFMQRKAAIQKEALK